MLSTVDQDKPKQEVNKTVTWYAWPKLILRAGKQAVYNYLNLYPQASWQVKLRFGQLCF